jgi:hypothetical protein
MEKWIKLGWFLGDIKIVISERRIQNSVVRSHKIISVEVGKKKRYEEHNQ